MTIADFRYLCRDWSICFKPLIDINVKNSTSILNRIFLLTTPGLGGSLEPRRPLEVAAIDDKDQMSQEMRQHNHI